MKLLLYFLAAINAAAFLAFGFDKRLAAGGGRRVPEARLLWLSALGGAPAAWLAMTLFRHKTAKQPFRLRMILATAGAALWLGAALWWLREN